jgi:hypothetical protein
MQLNGFLDILNLLQLKVFYFLQSHICNSKLFAMLIGQDVWILKNLLQDIVFFLVILLFHGSLRSNKLFLVHQLNLNIDL